MRRARHTPAAAAIASAAVLAGAFVLSGCGTTATDGHTVDATSMNRSSPPPPGGESRFMPARRKTTPKHSAVRVARTRYGRALVDTRGFALYLFTRDTSRPHSTSSCAGACAAAWPPYIVHGRHQRAASGADARWVKTIRRADGRLQLTYHGHPLYYYVGDKRPGEVLCQAVTEFGGTWYVVKPDGWPITRTS